MEQIVTGHIYLDMLQTFVEPQMLEQSIFQEDPAHYHNDFRSFLNKEQFPGCWIGRRGPITRQARSPDLTPNPSDFFLKGVKHRFCAPGKGTTSTETKAQDSRLQLRG